MGIRVPQDKFMTLTLEDYLLVMWEYIESFGKVSEADISKRLDIKAPTVNEYIKKLEQMGLVQRKLREVQFTSSGRRFTIPLVKAHRIAEIFAYRFLEVPWEEVHSGVMELEHLLTGAYGDRLYKHLGYPKTCPHGNPVSAIARKSSQSVTVLDEGKYIVDRVVFEDRALLNKLMKADMMPGTRVNLYKGISNRIEAKGGSVDLTNNESIMLYLSKDRSRARKKTKE